MEDLKMKLKEEKDENKIKIEENRIIMRKGIRKI